MSFEATVLQVLIASPSDVEQQRDQIERQINEWNKLYAEDRSVILLPCRWEDVAPSYNPDVADAQKILNEVLVKKCDIVIGVFWTKLGSQTTTHRSGSIEEISIFMEQGKDILVYFVEDDVPLAIAMERSNDLQKLREYKAEFGQQGIYKRYNAETIKDHLFTTINDHMRKRDQISTPQEVEHEEASPSLVKVPIIHSENEEETVSVEKLIRDNSLTNEEIVLLAYIMETGDRNLGFRWMANDTLERIRKWEEVNKITNYLSSLYSSAVESLCESGLIEEAEHTGFGNVRLYKMPRNLYIELVNLSEELQCVIKNKVELYKLIEPNKPF